MDDLKASMGCIEIAQTVHDTLDKWVISVGIVFNLKKRAIRFLFETPLPESLQNIPRLDETTNKYLVLR